MIRLLRLDDANRDICLETFDDDQVAPAYVILSHTWSLNENEEVKYQDLDAGKADYASKPGYRKLQGAMQRAAIDQIKYCWIDTCCINKRDSQEVTEAITSMFAWYKRAVKCYVYLPDVSLTPEWKTTFVQCRWFTRGWTLQELLAPSIVEFFSVDWLFLGDSLSLEHTIHTATNIPIRALRHEPLAGFSTEERMSWVESRTTKRPEDKAYCMTGIFDVTVVPAYGEGEKRARDRLMLAIKGRSVPRNLQRALSLDHREAYEDRPAKRPKIPIMSRLDPRQTEALLGSLKFDQIEARETAIKDAHAETCTWLLKDPQYTTWLDPESQDDTSGFLWIKGKPGSGKSTVMKFALENTRRTKEDSLILSFFFNARGADLERSVAGCYRTLLVQLLEQIPSLKDTFQILRSQASIIQTTGNWSTATLQTLLAEAAQRLAGMSVICFIDALDECDETDIREMIWFLDDLCLRTMSKPDYSRVYICFASRHYPHITIPRGSELVLDNKAGHKQDIISYIASKLRIGSSTVAKDIRSEVLSKGSGVFIWVILVVQILNKIHDEGGNHLLLQKLSEIPSDIHELFLSILARDSENKDGTKLCIQWILFSRNPLTVRQLYYAIRSGLEKPPPLYPNTFSEIIREAHVTPDQWHYRDNVSYYNKVYDDNQSKFILANSKGLAEISKTRSSSTVQFIHESVRDFLLKEKGLGRIWPDLVDNFEGLSHERLKECCLSYMRGLFSKTTEDDDEALNSLRSVDMASYPWTLETHTPRRTRVHHEINRVLPLMTYSTETVLYHADQASRYGLAQAEFLQDFELSHWLVLKNLFMRNSDKEVRRLELYRLDTSLLYILADAGASYLIQECPGAHSSFQRASGQFGTPLFAALCTGNKASVLALLYFYVRRLPENGHLMGLLKKFSSELNWQGRFSISYTFPEHSDVVTELLENANSSLCRFVLDEGSLFADADSSFLKSALRATVRYEHAQIDVLDVLLHRMMDLRNNTTTATESSPQCDEIWNSTFQTACVYHNIKAVESLLSRWPHMVVSYSDCRHNSTESQVESHQNGERLFKAVGTHTSIPAEWLARALGSASFLGHTAIVRMILDRDTEIVLESAEYSGVLACAIMSRRPEVIALLLERGAGVNSDIKVLPWMDDLGANFRQLSPRHSDFRAVTHATNLRNVRSLLDKSSSIHLSCAESCSVLINVLDRAVFEILQLLLEKGVYLDSRTGSCSETLRITLQDNCLVIYEVFTNHQLL